MEEYSEELIKKYFEESLNIPEESVNDFLVNNYNNHR